MAGLRICRYPCNPPARPRDTIPAERPSVGVAMRLISVRGPVGLARLRGGGAGGDMGGLVRGYVMRYVVAR